MGRMMSSLRNPRLCVLSCLAGLALSTAVADPPETGFFSFLRRELDFRSANQELFQRDADDATAEEQAAKSLRPFFIELSSNLLSPDGDGKNDFLSIGLEGVPYLSNLTGWNIRIEDANGRSFVTFQGSWPQVPIVWDGRGDDGSMIAPTSGYEVVANLRDENGNTEEQRRGFFTDVFAHREGAEYHLEATALVFGPFSAGLAAGGDPDGARTTAKVLDLVAAKLARYPGYIFRLEGHAVMTNWADPAKGQAEQREVLVPLSLARAEAVRDALLARGYLPARFIVEGAGARDPVVPDSDLGNRWKNRRVEIFLVPERKD